MLLSMTGFGEARRERDGVSAGVEVRTVNNRYFKLSLRINEGYSRLESEIESLIRGRINRGTVQVNAIVRRQAAAEEYRLNAAALDSYRRQLEALCNQWRITDHVHPTALLGLPGVADESSLVHDDVSQEWAVLREALSEALDKHEDMRRKEGQAMADNLKQNCQAIAAELTFVEQRASLVAESYRGRLQERIQKVLETYGVTLNPSDLVREVGLFADRSDISEETVRLRSHVEQFYRTMELQESSGRKLEFITQEMFRETNTIGSKANDSEISQRVIEIKTAIERMREMVQNVE